MPKRPSIQDALKKESPLQIIGVTNAYTAIMAESTGFSALYLSGAGVANASWGLPDLAMTHLRDLLDDADRILSASDLPLLVDIDTGWGSFLNIQRAIKSLERIGVSGVHIEDQAFIKRCGHRPNKSIVPLEEMSDRIKAALDAKTSDDFMVMARTDALASEGFDKMLERIVHFEAIGADAIFAEAVEDIALYNKITETVKIPVLANLTEFGKTPLENYATLKSTGLQMLLYPLSVFRAMNFAALNVMKAIKNEGSQISQLNQMQTREELYNFLNYHAYEQKIDQINQKGIEL